MSAVLEGLRAAATAAHDAAVALVDAVVATEDDGTVLAETGLPLDLLLAADHNMTGPERWTYREAARILPTMPTVWDLFRRRVLSWSQVRDIVCQARRLRADQRAELDGRIAASVDLVDKLDPDQLRWAVSDAVEELRGATAKERAEARQRQANFLSTQMALDGTVTGLLGLDPVAGAALLNTLDAHADALTANRAEDGEPTTRAQQRCQAMLNLLGIPTGSLGPDTDEQPTTGEDDDARAGAHPAPEPTDPETTGPATAPRRRAGHPRLLGRPLLTVRVDIHRDISVTATGLLEINLPRALPTLSAALVESLARSGADVQAVLFDGARPLCVTRKVNAADIPDDVRAAVLARDLGSRFPSGGLPAAMTDVHHLDGKAAGHHVDRLLALDRRWGHKGVHKRRWTATLDPDTGAVTWTRGSRSMTTLPWGTRLRRPSRPSDPDPPPGTIDLTTHPAVPF